MSVGFPAPVERLYKNKLPNRLRKCTDIANVKEGGRDIGDKYISTSNPGGCYTQEYIVTVTAEFREKHEPWQSPNVRLQQKIEQPLFSYMDNYNSGNTTQLVTVKTKGKMYKKNGVLIVLVHYIPDPE